MPNGDPFSGALFGAADLFRGIEEDKRKLQAFNEDIATKRAKRQQQEQEDALRERGMQESLRDMGVDPQTGEFDPGIAFQRRAGRQGLSIQDGTLRDPLGIEYTPQGEWFAPRQQLGMEEQFSILSPEGKPLGIPVGRKSAERFMEQGYQVVPFGAGAVTQQPEQPSPAQPTEIDALQREQDRIAGTFAPPEEQAIRERETTKFKEKFGTEPELADPRLIKMIEKRRGRESKRAQEGSEARVEKSDKQIEDLSSINKFKTDFIKNVKKAQGRDPTEAEMQTALKKWWDQKPGRVDWNLLFPK